MKKIWNNFTLPNEVLKEYVDVYKRVPIIINENDILTPSVSEYIFKNGFKPEYPYNKKFSVVISHDIDRLQNDDLLLMDTRHNGGVKSAAKVLKNEIINFIRKKSYKETSEYIPKGMRELLSLEAKYNIPASYYFLSLQKGEEDYNYDLNNIIHILEAVKKVGGEIGLHGGHKAYNSKEKIAEEKYFLEKYTKIQGYRNHYLRFDKEKTWLALEENNFLYDSTYGYAGCPGFRNGMCYPFNPFDLQKNNFLNIVELPLIYMDESPTKYLLFDEDNSWKLFCSLVQKVKEVNGVFTLLWHNTSMDEKRKNFYFKAIEYLREQDPWFATGEQVAMHYKENNYIKEMNKILTKVKNEGI